MFWIYSGVVFSVLASYFVYYSYKLWMQMNVGPELMEGGVVYYNEKGIILEFVLLIVVLMVPYLIGFMMNRSRKQELA